MIVSVDLTHFVGAEVITHDGVEGVFVPIPYNLTEKEGYKGDRTLLAAFSLYPADYKKSHDYSGHLVVPERYRDALLANENVLNVKRKMIWAYDTRKKEKTMSQSDFDKLVSD